MHRLTRLTGGALSSLALVCLFFHRAALTSQIFIQRDIQSVYYPVKQFWADQVKAGHFPGWYPFDGLGQPFVAMLVGSALHPSNLLYLVFSLGVALKWNLLLSYVAALMGMYCFLRALRFAQPPSALGAVAYAFCGYAVSMSNNLLYLMAAATLPWVLLTAHRFYEHPTWGRLLVAALVLCSVLLTGDAQAFVVAVAAVALQGALSAGPWAAKLGKVVGLASSAAILGMAQALPTLMTAKDAAAGDNPLDVALRWSAHPLRLLEMVVGPLFLNRAGDDLLSTNVARAIDPWEAAWANSQHIGVLVVLLAGVGLWAHRGQRAGRWLFGAAAVMFALWLGKFAGLYGLLHALPLWRAFRYPEKLSAWCVLLVVMAAAAGLQAVQDSPSIKKGAQWAAWALTLLLLGAVALEWTAHLYSHGLLQAIFPSLPVEDRTSLGETFVRRGIQSALFLVLGGLLLGRARRAVSANLLVVCVGLNLWIAQRDLYWTVPPAVLQQAPAFLQQIQDDDGPPALGRFRVVSYAPNPPLESKPEELSMADYVSQSEAMSLKSAIPALWQLESRNNYLPAANRRVLARIKPYADSGMLNTRYLVLVPEAAKRRARPEDVVATAKGQELMLVKAPDFVARTYLATPHCVADAAAAVQLIDGEGFVRGRDAAVECGGWSPPELAPGQGESLRTTELLSEQPDAVEVSVQAAHGALLVLNDAFYEGWSAQVDGAGAPILPANAMVRGVWVPSGTHRVTFSYRPPGFAAGLAVSATGFLLLLGLGLLCYGRMSHVRREASGEPPSASRGHALALGGNGADALRAPPRHSGR